MNIIYQSGSGIFPQYASDAAATVNAFNKQWTNSLVSVTVIFAAKSLNQGSANNKPRQFHVSYGVLRNALTSLSVTENNPNLQQAIASLPVIDPLPDNGTIEIPGAYAQMLGLITVPQQITVNLNSNLNWTGHDQGLIDSLEHEMSEGVMGRVGGVGSYKTNTANPGGPLVYQGWHAMDLFRFNASGARDTNYNDTTYFSPDGGLTVATSLPYDNAATGGDPADFSAPGDVFGHVGPNATESLSPTDIQIMDALGWGPTNVASPLSIHAPDDFNGDGKADMLWRNDSGDVFLWKSNGSLAPTVQDLGVADSTYFIAGTGVSTATVRRTSSFVMTPTTPFFGIQTALAGSRPWMSASACRAIKLPARGDFNGDGHADILWRNTAATRKFGFRRARARLASKTWASSTPPGKSQASAISMATARPTFFGAIRAARLRSGIRTAPAGSQVKTSVSSTTVGRLPQLAISMATARPTFFGAIRAARLRSGIRTAPAGSRVKTSVSSTTATRSRGSEISTPTGKPTFSGDTPATVTRFCGDRTVQADSPPEISAPWALAIISRACNGRLPPHPENRCRPAILYCIMAPRPMQLATARDRCGQPGSLPPA
jgi:hypothetical protein